MPPKRQQDQAAPKQTGPTGRPESPDGRAQAGEYLTTA